MKKSTITAAVNRQRIEELNLKEIIIGNYQRPISASRVNKIVAGFDAAKLNMLIVNRRADGSYAILDGQHRLCALRSMSVDTGLAIVLEGMTVQQEADYFRRQNENARTLNCYDLYNAGIVARDPHYLKIDQILKSHKYSASRKSGSLQVTAVAALSRIVSMFGYEVLDRIFAYLAATWPNDPSAVRREMLAGLADFVTRYGNTVTPEQFGARMKSKHPADLVYDFQRRTEGRGSARNAFKPQMRFTLCAVLVESYNKGLFGRSPLRLKLDWHMPVIDFTEGGGW